MFANAISAWNSPGRSMESIREVVAHAPVVKSSRGDAAEVAPLILQLLERRSRR
jgi:hypothetical protein